MFFLSRLGLKLVSCWGPTDTVLSKEFEVGKSTTTGIKESKGNLTTLVSTVDSTMGP